MKPFFDADQAATFLPLSKAEVRNMRNRMGMSQAELAVQLGVKEYTLWRWEHSGDVRGKKSDGLDNIPLTASLLLRRVYAEHMGMLKAEQEAAENA